MAVAVLTRSLLETDRGPPEAPAFYLYLSDSDTCPPASPWSCSQKTPQKKDKHLAQIDGRTLPPWILHSLCRTNTWAARQEISSSLQAHADTRPSLRVSFSVSVKSRIEYKQGLTHFLRSPYLDWSYSPKGRETVGEGEHHRKRDRNPGVVFLNKRMDVDSPLCSHADLVRGSHGQEVGKLREKMNINRNPGCTSRDKKGREREKEKARPCIPMDCRRYRPEY